MHPPATSPPPAGFPVLALPLLPGALQASTGVPVSRCRVSLTLPTLPLTLFLSFPPKCDVIIDESWVQSTGGLTEMDAVNPAGFLQTYKIQAYASQIPAVASKAVYSLAGTTGVPITRGNSAIKGWVGLDWFESGVSRADVVRDGRGGCCRVSSATPHHAGGE